MAVCVATTTATKTPPCTASAVTSARYCGKNTDAVQERRYGRMKTVIATLIAGLLVLGGLAWAQMEPNKHSGTTPQQSTAAGSDAGATQGSPQHPMQGMGGMMGSGMMGGMMRHMMGHMMGAGAQDDMPFLQRLLQQREQLGLSSEQVQQVQ